MGILYVNIYVKFIRDDPKIPSLPEMRSLRRPSDALLRLSIQMLCKHLGESGEDLNGDIANLVKKGLNAVVAKSLDVVRVIGNEPFTQDRLI